VPDEDEEEVRKQVELDSNTTKAPAYLRPLFRLTAPVIIISLLPQALTLVGIPFFRACVRRLYLAGRSNLEGRSLESGSQLGRFEERGTFLIPLNIISLLLACLFLLPIITCAAFFVPVFNRLPFRIRRGWFVNLEHLRDSLHALVGIVAFAYFPFFTTVPVITKKNPDENGPFPLWKLVVSFSWLVWFDVGFPIFDVVTDFQYSTQLLTLSRDPFLSERESLFVWSVFGFISSSWGLIFAILKVGFLFFPLLYKKVTRSDLEKIFISASPFGRAPTSKIVIIVRLLHGCGKDLLQLLVVSSTVSFVGRVDPLWSVKMTISLFSASFRIGKLATQYVFDRDIALRATNILYSIYFFLLSCVLASVVHFTLRDSFCDLSRTVQEGYMLANLGQCPDIVGNVTVRGITALSQGLSAVELSSNFGIQNNSNSVSVSFGALRDLWVLFTIVDNMAPVQVSFPQLDEIAFGGSLVVANNTGSLKFQAQFLFEVASGGQLLFLNNSETGILSLSSLTNVDGSVVFSGNSFQAISFPLLASVAGTGSLIFQNELMTNLTLDSLTTVSAQLEVVSNNRLIGLSLQSLSLANGLVLISGNPRLQQLSFPLLDAGLANIDIIGNPSLQRVVFPLLSYLPGQVTIENNANLTEVAVPLLDQTSSGVLIIASNPSLVTLDLSSLDCHFPSVVMLRNNLNLETVYLKITHCSSLIQQEGNSPNFKFVYLNSNVE